MTMTVEGYNALIDDDFLDTFISTVSEYRVCENIEEVRGWLNDYSTGWWDDCVHIASDRINRGEIYDYLHNELDWKDYDLCCAALSRAAIQYCEYHHNHE